MSETAEPLDPCATPIAAQLPSDCEVMARCAGGSGIATWGWLGDALAEIGT